VRLNTLFVLSALLVGCSAGDRSISVSNVWARATPPDSTVAAVYAEIVARETDELLGATAPVAERVEIHTISHADGMMQMRPVDSVPLPSGQRVVFESGGLHLMLLGLKAPLHPGERFPLTLTFKSAPPTTVEAEIRAPGDAHVH
jgi:copper(I)-binding protein